jgi:hypothetical protein
MCPAGCGKLFISKPIDKIIRNTLESLKFKCKEKGCGQLFMYADAFKHAQLCQTMPAVSCVLVCNDKTLFKGAQQMEDHLINTCLKMKGICSKCKDPMLRSQLGSHVCKQTLQQENNNLKAEVARLKQLNSQL